MDKQRPIARAWPLLVAVLLVAALLVQAGCQPSGRTSDNPFIGPSAGRGR